MEVKLTSAIYFGITLGFLIGFIWDLAQVQRGFMSKEKGQVGCIGGILLLGWIIFSLIWGGFFWW